MAEVIFISGAPAVAQVNTETPANPEINDIFTLKLENSGGDVHTITFTATAATVANVCTGLQAAAAAAATAETAPWDEVTATDDTTHLTITGDTAGVPFWVTTGHTDGGVAATETLTDANTTVCSGPGILSTVENYKAGALPATNTDSLTFDPSVTGTIYGYDMSAILLLGLKIKPGCDADFGGKGKTVHFAMSAWSNVDLSGTGASYLEIDNYGIVNVHEAGPGTDDVPWAMNLTGAHDDATVPRGTVNVQCGSNSTVGIGANAGEDMEANKLIVSDDATVEVGAAVTEHDDAAAPDIEISAGDVTTRCPLATVTMTGGKIHHKDAATLATANIQKGTMFYPTTGTLTNLHVYDKGAWDCSDSILARTVSNAHRYGEGKISDPHKTVTWSAGIDLHKTGVDANLDIGQDFTLGMSTI